MLWQCKPAGCCGECPCAFSDDFSTAGRINNYSRDAESGFVVSGGVLSSTADGAATQLVAMPTSGSKQIGVKAKVINNSHSMFGLVIGEGGSRVEWLWDTAGAHLTLNVIEGGSPILSESYAGDTTETIKVTVSGGQGMWDVTVFRDDVALETHSAVALSFDTTTGWIPVGVTSTGGGTWDDLCGITCDGLCRVAGCYNPNELMRPNQLKLVAGDVDSALSGPDDCSECCTRLSGDWNLQLASIPIPRWIASAACTLTDPWAGNPCLYFAVRSAEDLDISGSGGSKWGETCYSTNGYIPELLASVRGVPAFGGGWSAGVVPRADITGWPSAWTAEYVYDPDAGTVKIRATGSTLATDGIGVEGGSASAQYESNPVAIALPFDLSTLPAQTLSLVSQYASPGGNTQCTWPATITIEPAPIEEQEQALGCRDVLKCFPIVSEEGVLHLFGTIDGVQISVCLGGPEGLSTVGEWTGSTLVDTPTCGSNTPIGFRLYCKESEVDGVPTKEWMLAINDETTTDELPVEFDSPPSPQGTVSGTVSLCGGSLAFAVVVADFTGYAGPHPFLECCTPTIAEQCGLKDCFLADGQLTGGEGVCATTSSTNLGLVTATAPGTPTGYTDGDAYFFGDFPFDDSVGTYTGWTVMIYCGGGSGMQYAILDSVGSVQKQGALPGFSCATFTGGPIDVTDLIVVTSCYASYPGAQAFINLEPCA